MTHHKFIKFATKFSGKGSKLINFTKKFLEKLLLRHELCDPQQTYRFGS